MGGEWGVSITCWCSWADSVHCALAVVRRYYLFIEYVGQTSRLWPLT